MDGNWGKMDGKLDPLKTKQIHGSKPTKSQHTNKSQKNGAIFGGEFLNKDEKQQNKARNTTGRLRNRDQRGSRYQDDGIKRQAVSDPR